jgi:uncharacterized RDD family membrane protein YckC
MSRSRRTPRPPTDGEDEEPSLFDLPLEPALEPKSPAARTAPPEPVASQKRPKEKDSSERTPPAPRPVPKPAPAHPSRPRDARREIPQDEPEPESGEPAVGLKSRLFAGGADLLVHAAVAVAAVAGSRLLGAAPSLSSWPPIALFLLTFSFLYTVLPLAFWGQTLGMAWAGLIARSRAGEALTFDQTARRWLGGLVTAAALGLPLLFALGGRRSLADRLSGSTTYPTR